MYAVFAYHLYHLGTSLDQTDVQDKLLFENDCFLKFKNGYEFTDLQKIQ